MNSLTKPELSIIIPVYNGEDSLQELYLRLKNTLENKLKKTYEIIFIDDGSNDSSWNIIESLCNKSPKVKGIRFIRNFGQHPAIKAGIEHASGSGAILMDQDLESPPEDIKRLLAKAREGFEIVHGVREERKGNLVRIIGSKIYYWLLKKISGVSLTGAGASLRYISRKVMDEIKKIPEQPKYIVALIIWLGFKQAYIKTKHSKVSGKKSHYSYWKLLKMTIELILGFNPRLLRLITFTGFFISFIVFVMGFYYLIIKLVYNTVMPGFTSVILSITFLFGVNFIFLGVISEYLAKLFIALQGRPSYIVDEKKNLN